MITTVSITLVTLLGLTGNTPAAQTQPASASPNVAVLNLSEAFDKYRMTKALEEKFDARRAELAAQAERRRTEIDVKEQALASFKPGSSDYKARSEELAERQIAFQVWAANEERRLKEWHKEWMLKIYTDLQAAVAGVAQERGIALVLIRENVAEDAPDSNALRQQLLLQKVIYYDGKLDITEAVLAAANEAFRTRGGSESIKLGGD